MIAILWRGGGALLHARDVIAVAVGALSIASCGGSSPDPDPATDITAPSVPAITSAMAFSPTRIDVAWSAASDNVGVAGYRLSRNGTQIAAVATVAYSDTGLAANTQYCYRVAAFDAANNESAQSGEVCATTPSAPPDAPRGLDALGDVGKITLHWAPVIGATSYNIYFAAVAGVTKQNYASLQGGGRITGASSPHVHTGLENLKTCFYVVTAVGAAGEGAESLQLAAQPVAPIAVGWRSLQPPLSGGELASARFVDATSGWVVGEAGTVLHTGDAGTTWTLQDSRTASSLGSVDFVDAANGWAVGGGGSYGQTYATILRTTDGGATWRTQASGNLPRLYGVDFVDAAKGWAVGDNGTILHTDDGGATWSPQASGTSAILWKVKFINTSTGWVAGGNGYEGVVLSTTDGGINWTPQSIWAAQLHAIDFVSATQGWMVDVATPGRVFATNNGGATWGPLPTGSSAYLYGIGFADTLNGWAVGFSTGSWSGIILKSTNGGASWTPQTANAQGVRLHAVAAVGAQTAWAVGSGGTILQTNNGGATWVRQSGSRSLPGAGPFSFPSATHGWTAVGSTPYATTDGGLTWSARPVFSTEAISWFQFVNASAGWAVGAPSGGGSCTSCYGVYRTLDGGATWSPRGTIAGASALQVLNVDFLDDTRGWAVAVLPSGFPPWPYVILATTDGGASWSTKYTGTTGLAAVKVVDASTVWVVGLGGIIMKSTDGGATWLGQISGTTQDLRAIAAADANHAWVAGGNSSGNVAPLLATSDGGTHWVAQNTTWTGWFNDLYFVSATTGWAAGMGGLVLGTTDGGVTWTRQNVRATGDVYRVRFADTLSGWINADGNLLGTTSGGY